MVITRRTRWALVAGVAAAALAAPRAAHAAEAFYGVTANNVLVTFNSDSPGAIRTAVPISGLPSGEQILALDLRPASGQLYALGSTNRVYTLSPASGAATATPEALTPPLAGTSFGFDFNPVADRIRITSDGRQNLRVDPLTGAVAAEDPALAYADGDPGAGSNPHVGAVAYTNSVAGATETTLNGVETGRDVLVTLSPPNDGKLVTVGGLGVDLQEPAGFDIASDGRGWVAARRTGGSAVELFGVDLASGALAPAAASNGVGGGFGDVRGLAAAGAVPDDKTRASVVIGADTTSTRGRLRNGFKAPVSCSEACSLTATLSTRKSGRGRRLGRGSADLVAAGRVSVSIKPTTTGRRIGRRVGTHVGYLRIVARDRAGNRSTSEKRILFR